MRFHLLFFFVFSKKRIKTIIYHTVDLYLTPHHNNSVLHNTTATPHHSPPLPTTPHHSPPQPLHTPHHSHYTPQPFHTTQHNSTLHNTTPSLQPSKPNQRPTPNKTSHTKNPSQKNKNPTKHLHKANFDFTPPHTPLVRVHCTALRVAFSRGSPTSWSSNCTSE